MATAKAPRRRSAKSAQLSKHTRNAFENGQRFLERVTTDPALTPLREDPEGRQLIEQLRQDLSILGVAPTLRIGAARRLQGASSRRRTASHALFDACAEIRRRVKLRYRGPRHAELRRAFGEGLPASPAKPETVLLFSQQILAAAPDHTDALREVRVGPPTIQRVANLQQSLRDCAPERIELRTARRQVSDNLVQLATRVNSVCVAIHTLAARLCPPDEVQSLLMPEAPVKAHRARQRT
jgi:hypothetical protein